MIEFIILLVLWGISLFFTYISATWGYKAYPVWLFFYRALTTAILIICVYKMYYYITI